MKRLINNNQFVNGYEVLDLINYICAIEGDDIKNNIISLPEGSWNSFIDDNETGFAEIHSSHIRFKGGKLAELLTGAQFNNDGKIIIEIIILFI